jgi:hypothetical protein
MKEKGTMAQSIRHLIISIQLVTMFIIIIEQAVLPSHRTLYPIVNQYIHQQLHSIKRNSLQLLKLLHVSEPGFQSQGVTGKRNINQTCSVIS